MVEITDITQVFERVFAFELTLLSHPERDKIAMLALTQQTSERTVVTQVVEVGPAGIKALSRDYHPFTPAGTTIERQADYLEALQAIDHQLNDHLMAAA